MKKKIYTILLVLSLAIIMCLGVSAAEWTLSDDQETLISPQGEVYLHTSFNPSDIFHPENYYVYEQEISVYFEFAEYQKTLHIIINQDNDGIVLLNSYIASYGPSLNDDTSLVYIKQELLNDINAYKNGTFENYYLNGDYDSAFYSIDNGFMASLKTGTVTKVDVQYLDDCVKNMVYGSDKTDTLLHTVGCIYSFGTNYYYVEYDGLSNEHFAIDGGFSYRNGEVDAYVLEETTVLKIDDILENDSYQYRGHITFENDKFEYQNENPRVGFSIAMLVLLLIIFIAIPLMPTLMHIIKLIKNKAHNKNRSITIVCLGCLLIVLIIVSFILLFV